MLIFPLAENEKGLRYAINETTKDHAAWMQPAIDKLIKESGFRTADLNAIGVSIGPGSYTGIANWPFYCKRLMFCS
jgi:tRNA threonylcarbamoyladenosine biosynthesis protein TsaB